MKKLFFLLISGLALPLFAAGHPFTFNDMISMQRVGSIAAAPDGKQIAVVASEYSLEANRGNADIFLIDTATGHMRQLTNNNAADFNPIFSKDGNTLYFLSSRTGTVQIFALSMEGGEARQVTHFPVSIGNLKLSPKGNYFSFTTEVYPETSKLCEIAKRDKKKAESKCSARVYTELFVRHWDKWENGKWNHVFYMPVKGGVPVDVMEGMNGNCPSEPFGGPDEFNWSPDEKTIAFTTKLGRDRAWTTNFDVYAYDLASKTRTNLTMANSAWDSSPLYSPDGRYIYYLAMQIPGYEADRFRLMRRNLKTGKTVNLTENFQYSPSGMILSDSGKDMYFIADKEAHFRIFDMNMATNKITELVSQHTNSSLLYNGNHLFFTQNSLVAPTEVYKFDLKTAQTTKISHFNDERVKAVAFSEPEEFWFTDRDNVRVHGWLLRPVNFKEGQKYPLAFYIHGGPQGSWEDNFHYRWNLQILPAQGYVVVAIDFRGSTGYGDKFREAIEKHWGDRPFHDLMDGLDYVVNNYKFVDKNRMGALGASFGGFMINWIAGNAPNKFVCLINHDGDFDQYSSYYNTEELWFPEYEFGGTPFQNPKLYEKWSPSRYVKNWKTPMMVIHGGHDYRVNLSEGLSTFNALQRRGIPSKLIVFPDENHWVLKPVNSKFWHKSVIDWMNRWCKPQKQ
ncbi:MAG: S9 family peptidase [Acidobacteria bacterium]|nr:MAG: S9 family peptidase [Acidobacteriota bacterium]